jgi:hypothetical protein
MIKDYQFENSSMLFSCSYNDETYELSVIFVGGKEYTYKDVDKGIYNSLINAPSPGKYFNSIKSELVQK